MIVVFECFIRQKRTNVERQVAIATNGEFWWLCFVAVFASFCFDYCFVVRVHIPTESYNCSCLVCLLCLFQVQNTQIYDFFVFIQFVSITFCLFVCLFFASNCLITLPWLSWLFCVCLFVSWRFTVLKFSPASLPFCFV